MGDNGKYRVSSEGTVVFQREHGAPLTLTDVKYVPALKKNLVLVAMLEDKGYDVIFSKGKAFLRHIATASTAIQRYYVIFIDDFSHKCWIYFIQKKDQTFSRFCEFKVLAEKESGKKIKALLSDNGGEYVSQEFKDFCVAEGIKWELTAPHNPQQNGSTERKNRTIVGATQATMHDQGLPLHLCAEACNTTVYLQNRSLHHILGMKTQEEAFSRKRPNVGHFRIFGSSVYCHVTKDAQKKLESTTKLGILVGYTDTPHNYWVYFPTIQRIVVRRDLKFDELKAM
eukprot:PITA_12098